MLGNILEQTQGESTPTEQRELTAAKLKTSF
jgi:hypothetical protein